MVTEPEDIAMPNAGDGVCEVGMTDAGIEHGDAGIRGRHEFALHVGDSAGERVTLVEKIVAVLDARSPRRSLGGRQTDSGQEAWPPRSPS